MRADRKIVFVGVGLLSVAMLVLAACATYSIEKSYLAARNQYNDEVARYEKYYQEATPEQQAEYKEKVDPLVLEAEQALDLWGAALLLKNGDGTEMGAYLDAKNAMIDALVKAYGKEE